MSMDVISSIIVQMYNKISIQYGSFLTIIKKQQVMFGSWLILSKKIKIQGVFSL